ncbi:MAG: hypothetical protein CME43_03010 [Haliea sp.]|uniref:YcgL domain-containing protein n=1 Tax=Haliea sp. TaxID=1932666 RepID=UPI000C56DBBC|nr:YcgL domain-containing protein [Haliea sp.]MBM68431.1 hypothetical protein [Haliea sp.]
MTRICQVFRSPLKPEMYLYVDKAEGCARVPEALLARFGEPQPVLVLAISPMRKLARVNAADVLAGIESQGFFLQMPPADAVYTQRESARD